MMPPFNGNSGMFMAMAAVFNSVVPGLGEDEFPSRTRRGIKA